MAPKKRVSIGDAPESELKRPRRASAGVVSYATLDEEGDGGRRRAAPPPPPPSAAAGTASSDTGSPVERLAACETLRGRCAIALGVLRELDADGWFAQPVTEEVAPDYADVVAEPMDFATIGEKLEAGGYDDERCAEGIDAEAFASDCRLVYRNAVTFNWQPGNVVAFAAFDGLSAFESLLPVLTEGKRAVDASNGGEAMADSVRAASTGSGRRRSSLGGGAGAAGGLNGGAGAGAHSRGSARRTDEDHFRRLSEFVVACGGTEAMLDGWTTKTDVRMEGNSAGTTDTYFIPPKGRGGRMRSRAEVIRFLRLDYSRGKEYLQKEREEVKAAKLRAEQAAKDAAREAKHEARLLAKESSSAGRMSLGGGGGGGGGGEEDIYGAEPAVDDAEVARLPPPTTAPAPRPAPADGALIEAALRGLPSRSVGSLLMAADFLHTGREALGLPDVGGARGLAALMASAGEAGAAGAGGVGTAAAASSGGVMTLATLHAKLLRLVLADHTAAEWWIQDVPPPTTAAATASAGASAAGAAAGGATSVGEEAALSGGAGAAAQEPWWAHDAPAPLATDEAALLASALAEPDASLRAWVSLVEATAPLVTVDHPTTKRAHRAQIASLVERAATATASSAVERYLRGAALHGASVGKACALWLAAQVRAARPSLFGGGDTADGGAPADGGDAAGAAEDDGSARPPSALPEGNAAELLWSAEACDEEAYDWANDWLPDWFIDRRMGYSGASADGWRARPRGRLGRKSGNWQWVSPWGEAFNLLFAAKEAADERSKAQARLDTAAVARLREHAALLRSGDGLLGWVVAVRTAVGAPWRTALVSGYDAAAGTHTLRLISPSEDAEAEAEAAFAAALARAAASADAENDAETTDASGGAAAAAAGASSSAKAGARDGADRPSSTSQFQVERLVRAKGHGKARRYQVKWAGYSMTESTWEPAAHLHPQLVAEFEASARERAAAAATAGRTAMEADDDDDDDGDGGVSGYGDALAAAGGEWQIDLLGGRTHIALVYDLNAPALARARHPPRPSPKLVSSLTWPRLAAAAALRLSDRWGEPPLMSASAAASVVFPGEGADANGSGGGDAGGAAGGPLFAAIRSLLGAAPSQSDAAYRRLAPEEKVALLACLTSAACDTAAAARAFTDAHARWVDACATATEARRDAKRLKDEVRVEIRAAMEGAAAAKAAQRAEDPANGNDGGGGEGGGGGATVSEKAVTTMAEKLREADAIGGAVTVLTRADLAKAEMEAGVALELLMAPVDADGEDVPTVALEWTAKLRDELRRRRTSADLRTLRDAAQAALDAAAAEGRSAVGDVSGWLDAASQHQSLPAGAAAALDARGLAVEARARAAIAALDGAIGAARAAALEGHTDVDGVGTGGFWMVDALHRAVLVRASLLRARGTAAALAETRQEALRSRVPRIESLGTDRHGRRHWALPPRLSIGAEGAADGADGSGDDDLTVGVWLEPWQGAAAATGAATLAATGTVQGPPVDTPGGADGWRWYAGGAGCQALAASYDTRGRRERVAQSALLGYSATLGFQPLRTADDGAAGEGEGGGAKEDGEGEGEGEDDDDEQVLTLPEP